MSMTEITDNIREELAELQKFTATPGSGVTRFPFTEEARRACWRGNSLLLY